MSDKRYITGKVCSELRRKRKENVPYENLDDQYTLDLEDILHHVLGECDCDSSEPPLNPRKDTPWRERYVMEQLYEQKEKIVDISEVVKCNTETVTNYIDEIHDISSLDRSERTSSPRANKLLEQDSDIL